MTRDGYWRQKEKKEKKKKKSTYLGATHASPAYSAAVGTQLTFSTGVADSLRL